MSDENDFEALKPSRKVKISAGLTAVAGFWTLLLANQSLNIMRFQGIWALIIVIKFALAISLVFLSVQTAKMRRWGVQGGMGVSVTTCLLATGWLIFSFMNSLLSFMPLMVVPFSALAAIFAFLARSDVRKAELAREKMAEGGLDLGM